MTNPNLNNPMKKQPKNPWRLLPLLLIIILLISTGKDWQENGRSGWEYNSLFLEAKRIPPIETHIYRSVGLVVRRTEKMDRIIFCESTDNPEAYNEKSGALGLCQMIPLTRDYVEKKWNMEIDWQDPLEQRYACERLLQEEGDVHWLASKDCWAK